MGLGWGGVGWGWGWDWGWGGWLGWVYGRVRVGGWVGGVMVWGELAWGGVGLGRGVCGQRVRLCLREDCWPPSPLLLPWGARAEVLEVQGILYRKYTAAGAVYHTLADSAVAQEVPGLQRPTVTDPGVLRFLCSVTPSCAAVSADGRCGPPCPCVSCRVSPVAACVFTCGFVRQCVGPTGTLPLLSPPPNRVCSRTDRLAPFDATPTRKAASTLHQRHCDATACLAPGLSPAGCAQRCNCAWDADHSACGCVGLPGHPSCELAHPTPAMDALDALAASGAVQPGDRLSLFGDSLTWLGGWPEARACPCVPPLPPIRSHAP